MTFTTLAIVYVLGGLTFLPLLVAAILIPAWYLLPRTRNGPAGGSGDDKRKSQDAQGQAVGDGTLGQLEKDGYTNGEGSAAVEASFAVLRSYHFPSALTALNARASGTANGVAGANGSTDGAAGDAGGSSGPSVYQSMYRTVFDRGKTSADTTTSVLAKDGNGVSREEDATGKPGKKAVVSASVFYIVLRHGHLMLYDSPAHLEVRHVISMAHHTVSLTDGEQDVLPDADLFIKRTAIVLTPIHDSIPNGFQPGQPAASPPLRPKPFYFFSSTCIEKEDFYHALLSTRASPPIPRLITPEDLIKLQSTLHSTSLTPETRAFNAIIGRIFLAFHRTPFLEQEIRTRIEKKIARVQKPTFIASLEVESIDLGNSAPVLSQPRLKDINISGDLTLSFDLRYAGGVRVGIAAVAKIDLGARFKPRSVDLVLSTLVQRFSGKMLVRIKPPPSNRIWFCFESAPDMEIKVEPVVSSRHITYAFILRAIEERIRAVVAETLVKPNWDDVPFFDTRSQRVRGGMWSDEGVSDTIVAEDDGLGSAARTLLGTPEKSMSMPALNAAVEAMENAGASSGSDTPIDSAASTSRDTPGKLKRRSVASLPLKHASTMPREMAPPPPSAKPLRSPSFTSPPPSAPIVAVDDVSGVPVRSDDADLQPKKWHMRASAQTASRKEAVQAVREMRDRSMPVSPSTERPGSAQGPDTSQDSDIDPMATGSRRSSDTPPYPTSTRTDTLHSKASTTSTSSDTSRKSPNQRKNLLAATAAATTAARNWGWNAIAARTGRDGGPRQPLFRAAGGSASSSQTSIAPIQPMGRGQPLPPPGTPLPGPQKGLFAGLGGAVVGGKGSIKRKPVLPPRRSGTVGEGLGTQSGLASASETSLGGSEGRSSEVGVSGDEAGSLPPEREMVGDVEDDFGPWRENSGRDGLYEGHGWGAGSALELASEDRIAEELRPSTASSFAENDEVASEDNRTPVDARSAQKPIPPPLPARRRQPAADTKPEVAREHRADREPRATTSQKGPVMDDDGIRVRGHEAIAESDTTDGHEVTDELSMGTEAEGFAAQNGKDAPPSSKVAEWFAKSQAGHMTSEAKPEKEDS